MFVPVNEPIVSTKAKEYVINALNTGWISSAGTYIDKFESAFAEYLGVKHATTVSNGTTALHLALDALGVNEGDEVIIPNLTIISCAAAVVYLGARPVFVDVEKNTGNIDPTKIVAAITPKTKAIMVVDLYGHPADFDAVRAIASKHKLPIIEDAAEAHGAEYKEKKAGSLGDIATFSFYANKILTTGEGGMVVTNNDKWIETIRQKKNLCHAPGKRFWHTEIGYNYRMTNLQAALGLGHLEEIDSYIKKKLEMVQKYNEGLKDVAALRLPTQEEYAKSVFWMYNIELTEQAPFDRLTFMARLKEKGVDTRTYFYPMHEQPVLSKYVQPGTLYPVSKHLSEVGLYLPSGLAISDEQIDYVVKTVKEVLS